MFKTAEKIGNMLAGKKTPKTQSAPRQNTLTVDQSTGNYIFFQIKPFKDNDRGIGHRDTVIKNLISLKRRKIIFMMRGNSADIKLYVGIPKNFKNYFENTFYASFPTSDIVQLKEEIAIPLQREKLVFSKKGEFLTKEQFTRDGSYMDPMNGLFALYNLVDSNSRVDIYFNYVFSRSKLHKYFHKLLDVVRNPKKKTEDEDKKPQIKPDVFAAISFKISCKDHYATETIRSNIKAAFSPFISNGRIKIKNRQTLRGMSYDQAVNFFHVPTMANFIKGLDYTLYRKLPYPTNLPTLKNSTESDLTILGNTDYRGEKITFGIRKEDKFRHMYIVGKTGTGKSTFISNMVVSDMKANNGLCLIDPHGELVDTVMEHIPTHRINDVILFDVSDTEYPLGFNLLQSDTPEGRNLVASGVVSTFKKLFEHSWGPRLEYCLRNVTLSLVDYPNATLMHILRMLTDKNFREEVISHITDGLVVRFWRNEFDKWNDKQREEAIGPITNKVGQFLSSKLVRNIFGQPRTKLDIRKAMDDGKIILINLSKGRIGEDNANMIGSLIVTKIQIDAMSRADIPAEQRRDFYLYIDEFQNFATQAFTTIFSEARKYKLSLIVANQYTSQLLPEIKDAIFGNVGTTMSFTVGKDDADLITGQFKELASVNDLISLPKYTTYMRLMIDGISSDPFSMKTLPIETPDGSLELIDKIRKQSRQRYAMQKDQLEKLMDAWNKRTFSLQEKVMEKAKLEALGLNKQETENYQDQFVQQHAHLFTEYEIDETAPDAIIYDTANYSHKAVWYEKPKSLENQAGLKYSKGQKVQVPNGEITMSVDIYQHQTITIEGNNGPLMIRIGDKQEVMQQLNTICQSAGMTAEQQNFMKFVPNVEKLQQLHPELIPPIPQATHSGPATPKVHTDNINIPAPEPGFSIKDIKLGERYEGYIKLSYNYGMFVTVKGVEGLLHKNRIVAPDGVDRKKYYNIGDKIKVKAKEYKEVNGEQKVVRSQK